VRQFCASERPFQAVSGGFERTCVRENDCSKEPAQGSFWLRECNRRDQLAGRLNGLSSRRSRVRIPLGVQGKALQIGAFPLSPLRRSRSAYDAFVKQINCVCGAVVKGEDDDELWEKAQAHLHTDHPDLVGKVSREDILAQAEET
jgi:hypothetical protein